MDAHSFIEHNGDLFFIGRVTRPKNLDMAQWPNGPMDVDQGKLVK